MTAAADALMGIFGFKRVEREMKTDRELLELAARRSKHGMNKTPEHRVWVGMKQRCSNPKRRDYKWYGAKGVKVCKEWMDSFESFFEHVGPRPSPSHTIDRINVDGDYEPGNVRWATMDEQINNTTAVRMISIGDKTQSISAWEREMGLCQGQVRKREKSGWSIVDAILTPSIPGQKTIGRGSKSIVRAAAAIGESL